MNRKHTVEEYISIIERLKKINSNIKFSSDFIIGYPGETNTDFDHTISLIKKIKFVNSFSFIFSPRPGTKASTLDLIDRGVTKTRLLKIQDLLFKFQKEMNNSLVNKTVEALVENKIKGENKLFGKNKYLSSVIFEGDKSNIGKKINVKIESCNQNTLFGKIETKKMKAA